MCQTLLKHLAHVFCLAHESALAFNQAVVGPNLDSNMSTKWDTIAASYPREDLVHNPKLHAGCRNEASHLQQPAMRQITTGVLDTCTTEK